MHSLAAAASSEGSTARTSVYLDLCHSSVVKVQPDPRHTTALGAERTVSGPVPGLSNLGLSWRRPHAGCPGDPKSGLERACLQQEKDQRAGHPALQRELGRARGAHRTDEEDVDDDPDEPGEDNLRASKDDLDQELVHARSPIARRPWSARINVTSSAYSRS